MKLGESVYKSQQSAGPQETSGTEEGKDSGGKDDVVDADFTEVKDDDKKSA
jgi:molecular chaperone DnaK